mmetsp:Transcript_28946/g.65511  ORF Transcript_28946/g.65511 Transcript_28946/m.65511 type:complete len:313 (+) Transcript_28946:77-1015(+)
MVQRHLKLHLRRRRCADLISVLSAWYRSCGPVLCVAAWFSTAVCYFALTEGWSVNDSCYFAVAVLTTVGYGDLAPSTAGGKLVTIGLAMTAMAYVAGVASGWAMGLAEAMIPDIAQEDGLPDYKVAARQKQARFRGLMVLSFGIVLAIMFVGKEVVGLESFLDSFYFAVITLTSVGFGDHVPEHRGARCLMSFLMMLGLPVFSAAVESWMEVLNSTDSWVELITPRFMSPRAGTLSSGQRLSPPTSSLLVEPSAAEIEAFRSRLYGTALPPPTVQREDLLAFKLVQRGKILMEDVQEAFKEFHVLKSPVMGG